MTGPELFFERFAQGLVLKEGGASHHFGLLALGLLPGAALGTALSVPLGIGLQREVRASVAMAAALTVFPWRSVVVLVAVLGLMLSPVFFGLGFYAALPAAFYVGGIAALGIGTTAIARAALPDSVGLRAVRTLRTVLIFGSAFVFVLTMVGVGGVGDAMLEGLQRLDLERMGAGIGEAVIVLLLPDLIVGGIQAFIVIRASGHAND